MGFLNKVKNIFFEEEIVEIEDSKESAKKEAPVAKKIELPKAERVEKIEHEEDVDIIDLEEETPKENKFPMDFDEDDFKEEPVVTKENYAPRRSERHRPNDEEPVEQVEVYEEVKTETRDYPKYDFEDEYGKEKDKEKESHGLYEGKNPKKVFTPTPIISPIYGILDKNYKKDDVVTKKEIRLSSAPKKIDLDSVREKAYGDLSTDISQSMEEVTKGYEDDDSVDLTEDDELLYDLNDNESSPAVKEVTVGDAEEYFNELGLEYNIDYKDTSVEKSKTPKEKTRRSTPEPTVETPREKQKKQAEEEDGLESNLFDLIESMYDEKE